MKLEDIKSGIHESGDCGNPTDQLPSWLDMDRFRRGQQFIQKNIFANVLALHFSLVSGFSIINLLGPLVFTNMTETPIKSIKRYGMTVKHIYCWYTQDIWDYPDGIAHKSITLVRSMHSNVAKSLKKKFPNENHMSQYDMVLVQTGFIAATILHTNSIGITFTKQEMEDFIYFWRGVGYLLGIDDKYNMCKGGYAETYQFCSDVQKKILFPSLKDTPKDFIKMATAYCDGMNIMVGFPLHTLAADSAFVVDSIGHKAISRSLCWTDTLRFYFWKVMMWMIMWCPGFHSVANKYFVPLLMNRLTQITGADRP